MELERLKLAFLIPIGVAIFIFIVVFAYSRILLGVGDQMLATTIATIGGLAILAVCTYLANRPGGRGKQA